MEWIRCVRCKKSRRDFVARTFALIAQVHSVLHRVSCSYEMNTNAHKHYETHQNMSLGSNGVDWVHSLWKIPTWLRGSNFGINCTSSTRFGPSFLQLRNDPKCTQTLWKAPNHEFRVQWGGSGAFIAKNFRCDFIAQTCPLIAPVQPILHRISCSNETLPNAPNTTKCSKTLHKFIAKNSNAT